MRLVSSLLVFVFSTALHAAGAPMQSEQMVPTFADAARAVNPAQRAAVVKTAGPGLTVPDAQGTAPQAAAPITVEPEPEGDLILSMAKSMEVGPDPERIRQAMNLFRQYGRSSTGGKEKLEAIYGIGRCHARLGNHWKSFLALEDSYPMKVEPFRIAQRVDLQFRLARAITKYRRRPVPDAVVDGRQLLGYEAAAHIFAAIVYNDPQSEEAPASLLWLGDLNLVLEDADKAAEAYSRLIRDHPDAAQVREAHAGLATALISRDYKDNRVPARIWEEAREHLRTAELDPRPDRRVAIRLERYRARAARVRSAQMLHQASFYLRSGLERDRRAAVFMLRDLLQRYPDSKAAEGARRQLAELEPVAQP